jgi:flagellar biosynthesis protein FliQ
MDAASALFREGLLLLVSVGGPLFGILLIVGLGIGVLQAATQINDVAVSSLPRLGAAILACVLLGGWMVGRLSTFLAFALSRMAGP